MKPPDRFGGNPGGFMHRFAVPLLAAILVFAAAFTGLTETADRKLLDAQFRVLRQWHPQSVAQEVVVVGIDDETARQFPEPIALWHRHLGAFFSAMAAAGPSVVGVDVVLPDRSFDGVMPGSDRELMKGILTSRGRYPLTLALTVDPAGQTRPIYPAFLGAAGPGSTGFALFPTDPDHRVRRFDDGLGEAGKPVATLVGQMARRLKLEPSSGLIDYSRGGEFSYIPLQQVLQWHADHDDVALEKAFRGKPVLLGAVFPFVDRIETPVPLAAWDKGATDTPGVLVHAQALRNLLNEGLVRQAPAAWIAVLVALAALLWFVSVSTRACVAMLLAIAVAILGAATALLAKGLFVPAVMPLLAVTVSLGGRNAYDTLLQLRERRRLRASFSGYVSPTVMDEILAGHIQPELGGAKKNVCVLFSDIRGYTKRSEGQTPEQVIQFLNRYFEKMVGLIHERGGWVACFMGDGIMAVFGAPKRLANPCEEAFECARSMLHFIRELNREFAAEGLAPIDIGVGIQVGDAIVGHVGSAARHDFTAIGDVTNVASRLESLTKDAGYRIVVSKMMADRLAHRSDLVALGPMSIKGHSAVDVYGHDKV